MSSQKALRPPPTVALIVNTAWVAWKFRARLMSHLREAGWRVVLLADTTADAALLEGLCDEVVHVGVAATRIDPLADLRTFGGYFKALRRLRPAAVLGFTIKPNIYGSLACRMLGIPVVNNVTGLGTIKGKGALVGALVRHLYRAAFARSSWVFFQNAEDAAQMERDRIVDAGRWSVLPGSGVDTGYYQPAPESESGPGATVRFCMLARLLRDKGVVEYAEAARRVRRERPGARFELCGILDASDARFVERATIDGWVAEGLLGFRGEVADAQQAFCGADVVVLPSYYPEGLPRTLLEAGAMGLPCITTDSAGCRDAVEAGATGLLCAPRDVDSLAQAMLQMIDLGPQRRRAMGCAARARVLERFDERLVLKAYDDCLAAVVPSAPLELVAHAGR